MNQVGSTVSNAVGEHVADYRHYGLLLVMAVLFFLSMYILMYAMVDRVSNVYPNLNQFYMAGLMTAPMLVIELCIPATRSTLRSLSSA
jgi:hypothetical protein